MSTRRYPYPDSLSGLTFAVAADPQMGYRDWTQDQVQRVGEDLDSLAPFVDAYIHVGDLIHWGRPGVGPEDAEAINWLNDRYAATNKDWIVVAGNHDLSSFNSPYPNRSSQEWANLYGMASSKNILDIGHVRLIGASPERWDNTNGDFGQLIFTPNDLAWIETQISTAVDKDVWLVIHTPPRQHFASGGMSETGLSDIIGAYPNVVGWVSGHRHPNPYTDYNHVDVINVGGRDIYSLNCPSGGGKTGGTDGSTPFDDTVTSAFFTYKLDGTVEVRWRNHLTRSWIFSVNEKVRLLSK